MMRYFVGLMVAIGLVIVLLVLLLTGGGGKHKVIAPKSLSSYSSTDAQVRLTIDGPITAAQTHQQVQITVDNSQAVFQELQGYDGSVVTTRTYPSSQNGYYAFLRALTQAGFTRGNADPNLTNDSGFCPLGSRDDLTLTQDGKALEHYWITSCGGLATYQGNFPLTKRLFEAQIPDYGTLTAKVALQNQNTSSED